ncbi:hypothetical protein EDEG_02140 [Edhazardia aedis USNM 41457]|uniref:Uncharacterized protein n=1 Tax=Edhazardia aedis (strain USNM 41457) TaxID=1003232 RepID=J9D718_EDHAE|nr:hypothetical protein EDEG_02140 [Edhazardia aedis USNM 41457]|eukprot:EJW03556.1 hypothetical protein EDEG_02140 [Edhazardia aedis USNM 41457]
MLSKKTQNLRQVRQTNKDTIPTRINIPKSCNKNHKNIPKWSIKSLERMLENMMIEYKNISKMHGHTILVFMNIALLDCFSILFYNFSFSMLLLLYLWLTICLVIIFEVARTFINYNRMSHFCLILANVFIFFTPLIIYEMKFMKKGMWFDIFYFAKFGINMFLDAFHSNKIKLY